MLNIGFGKTKITPPVGILMAGHLNEKRSIGIHDDLFSRAVVIDDGDTKVCLVSCDVLLFENEFIEIIRQKIEKKCHISRENIFICATHNHSGPLFVSLFGAKSERTYEYFLQQQIVSCIEMANDSLRQAKIGFFTTDIETLSFNRRFIMDNGTVETHPAKGNPHIVKAEGETDPELGVIYVCDLKNEFMGAVVNYACHPTCVERKNKLISADFPGYIEKTFQEDLKNSAVILFCNGACGNICQVNVGNSSQQEAGFSWAEHMGKRIAKETVNTMGSVTPETDIKIKPYSKIIRIPIREVTGVQIKESEEILSQSVGKEETPVKLSDYGTEGLCDKSVLSVEEIFSTQLWKRIQAKELLSLAKKREKNQYAELEISILSIGEAAIVMIPCELFTEFGLEIKKVSKFKHTFVVGYANGYNGYVPTKVAFQREGGYETKLLGSSKLVPEAGNMIVKTVSEMFGENKK